MEYNISGMTNGFLHHYNKLNFNYEKAIYITISGRDYILLYIL